MSETAREHAVSWALDYQRADPETAEAYGDYFAGLDAAGDVTVHTSHGTEWPYFVQARAEVSPAERLALQERLHAWRLRRLDAVPGSYTAWPEDSWAAELDELAHDIAFERASWLAPAGGR